MPDLNGALQRFAGKIDLENVFAAALTLLVCLLAARLLLKLVRRLLGRTKLEERVRRYILAALKLLLYTLTAVFTAGSLGIDMTSLVALLSVGSLGVTLAAEDILGNVAGGLVILSSHPFAIGDFIESGGVSGTVEEINLNHTKLVTPDGLTALLPNKVLAASQVTNYTVLGRRRIVWKMTAAYGASTETVKAACLRAVEATEHILPDPAPAVYLTAFGESGVDYTVYCWAAAADFWATRFALAENLRAEFGRAGIEIPYNRLDVRIQKD
ncbi:mechanosensitive ion channel family protein [uncultured Oscillibacter sp.]|uniref:mechanosensitive ion channel family protein n=1 Tax=uncultured Oscillibacter sp. TaxID=876091 RepID=UPI00262BB9BA|nr:mechanosensitive ion channel family protein [uncultured Oscillibacter sp.]